jgi:hypothetical protein
MLHAVRHGMATCGDKSAMPRFRCFRNTPLLPKHYSMITQCATAVTELKGLGRHPMGLG